MHENNDYTEKPERLKRPSWKRPKTYAEKKLEQDKRLEKKRARRRHVNEVHKWEEWRQFQRIKLNPVQPAMTDFMPKKDAKKHKKEDEE